MTEISNLSMLSLFFFVLVPLLLSYMFALGLSRSIIWSTLRGTVQLFFIGYVLTFLFSLSDWKGISIMVLIMIFIATFQASKRGKGIPHVKSLVFFILLVNEGFVLTLWMLFDMIPFTAEKVIPMSGMIIGNSMIAAGLALERMKNEFSEGRGRILAALSLGATAAQASKLVLRKTIKAAMIPNVDGLKTIGIVQLPGMMTGLILAGASPIDAIRYQIVISISIFSSVSFCAMLVTVCMYRFFFNKQLQLRN